MRLILYRITSWLANTFNLQLVLETNSFDFDRVLIVEEDRTTIFSKINNCIDSRMNLLYVLLFENDRSMLLQQIIVKLEFASLRCFLEANVDRGLFRFKWQRCLTILDISVYEMFRDETMLIEEETNTQFVSK